MATKSNRYIDNQGRVVLPSHIRENLNLQPGNLVSVRLEDDGTIRITPEKERCTVCGMTIDGYHTEATIGKRNVKVCYTCAQTIAKAMME